MKSQSLFKQKLRQQREKQPKQSQLQDFQVDFKDASNDQKQILSFPKPFKIDNSEAVQCEEKISSKSTEQSLQSPQQTSVIPKANEQSQQDCFISSLKKQDKMGIPGEQLEKIDSENWKAIESMTDEQRKQYLRVIETCIPSNLVSKLKKKQRSQSPLNQKQISERNSEQKGQNVTTNNEGQLLNRFGMSEKVFQDQLRSQEAEETGSGDSQCQYQRNIFIDIKTQKLHYLPQQVIETLTSEQRAQYLSSEEIYGMIKSENNQSQIVGAKMTLAWIKSLQQSRVSTSSQVVKVNAIPFHFQLLSMQCLRHVEAIEGVISRTKFKSCYVEMLACTAQIVVCIQHQFRWSLTQPVLQNQVQFFDREVSRLLKQIKANQSNTESNHGNQNNHSPSEENKMLCESLIIVLNYLKEAQHELSKGTIQETYHRCFSQSSLQSVKLDSFEFFNTRKIKQEDIQLLLLEQTLTSEEIEKNNLRPLIVQQIERIQTLCHLFQGLSKLKWSEAILVDQTASICSLSFINYLYEIAVELNNKALQHAFYKGVVREILNSWKSYIYENISTKILSSILNFDKNNMSRSEYQIQNKILNFIFYKTLYLAQEVSGQSVALQNLSGSNKDLHLSEWQSQAFVYFNFKNYYMGSSLKVQEISLLEKMIDWATDLLAVGAQNTQRDSQKDLLKVNISEFLRNFLGIFLTDEEQIYSLLDQSKLSKLLNLATLQYSKKYERCPLNESEIKKIIQNYNFNSFGNDIFTSIMFWLAVSFNPEIELTICQEVMTRYPMLFYYAAQQTSDTRKEQLNHANIFSKSLKQPISFIDSSNKQIKKELLQLLGMNMKIPGLKEESLEGSNQGFNIQRKQVNQNNVFYKYLMRSLGGKGYQQLF